MQTNTWFSKLITLVLCSSLFTSCATIMNGTRQNIGIASNPTNANVWVDRCFVGNTPLIVQMSRKDSHTVYIELEGYQPYEAVFTRSASGWVLGNIVFGCGAIIGLAVDAISGGLYKLTPDQIQADMKSNGMCCCKSSKDSYITIVLEPKADWEKVGNLVAVN